MSNFRVIKTKRDKGEFIESIDFEQQDDADHYAHETSLNNENYLYTVERKINNDDYQAICCYRHGQRTTTFD